MTSAAYARVNWKARDVSEGIIATPIHVNTMVCVLTVTPVLSVPVTDTKV